MLQYPGSATSLSPSAAPYGTGVYDFANQYNPAQLEAVNFQYGTQAVAAAAAAAGLGNSNQSNAAANYAYAALAQQAIPSLTAAYQQ